MAKRRRKSNKPNLPTDVLARARKNAGIEDEIETNNDADNDPVEAVASAVAADEDSASVSQRAARRRGLPQAQIERSRKRGELSNEMISDLLHHPTRVVTEEELHKDYQHVLVDLRNMGILAAILIVVMMGLASIIPAF